MPVDPTSGQLLSSFFLGALAGGWFMAWFDRTYKRSRRKAATAESFATRRLVDVAGSNALIVRLPVDESKLLALVGHVARRRPLTFRALQEAGVMTRDDWKGCRQILYNRKCISLGSRGEAFPTPLFQAFVLEEIANGRRTVQHNTRLRRRKW